MAEVDAEVDELVTIIGEQTIALRFLREETRKVYAQLNDAREEVAKLQSEGGGE